LYIAEIPQKSQHARNRDPFAATAVSLDYTVATVNIRDFEKIPGVKMEKLQSP